MAFFNTKQIKTLPVPVPDRPDYFPPTPPTPPTPGSGSNPYFPPKTFTGSVKVDLYINSDDRRRIKKTLDSLNKVSFDIVCKNDVSVENPVILLESIYDLTMYNYMYIDKADRYYYITIEYIQGNLYKVTGVTDVLMSAGDGLKECVGILKRTEEKDKADLYINDGSLVYTAETFSHLRTFINPSELNKTFTDTSSYVLITLGKGFSTPSV